MPEASPQCVAPKRWHPAERVEGASAPQKWVAIPKTLHVAVLSRLFTDQGVYPPSAGDQALASPAAAMHCLAAADSGRRTPTGAAGTLAPC